MLKSMIVASFCGILAALTLLGMTYPANAQSVPPADTPVITLTVRRGTPVKFCVGGPEGTSVWVEQPAGVFLHTKVGMPPREFKFTASGTTIHIYGDVSNFECDANQNSLTALDVSQNIQLEVLECSNNALTTLDVSKNSVLRKLGCGRNRLTSLDVSKNTRLVDLACEQNQLTTLDLSNNLSLKNLECHDNLLTSLDLSVNGDLHYLDCKNNQLTSLVLCLDAPVQDLFYTGNALSAVRVKPLPLPEAELQRLPVKGAAVGSARYSDRTGDNAVVLAESSVTTSKENNISYLNKELYAYRFQETDNGQMVQKWRITDFVHDCDLDDMTAEFLPDALHITDLDKDGFKEVWVGYRLTCRNDPIPRDMKIIMYEDVKKYAVRGTDRLTFPSGEVQGGNYKLDPAFTTAPAAFRTYAEDLWRHYLDETR